MSNKLKYLKIKKGESLIIEHYPWLTNDVLQDAAQTLNCNILVVQDIKKVQIR